MHLIKAIGILIGMAVILGGIVLYRAAEKIEAEIEAEKAEMDVLQEGDEP